MEDNFIILRNKLINQAKRKNKAENLIQELRKLNLEALGNSLNLVPDYYFYEIIYRINIYEIKYIYIYIITITKDYILLGIHIF